MVNFKIWRGCTVSTVCQAVEQKLGVEWSYGDSGGVIEEMKREIDTLAKHSSLLGNLVSALCEKGVLTKSDVASLLGEDFSVRDE